MIRILSLICITCLAATTAAAHPHVWVTGETAFRFEDTKVTRIGMRWRFDMFFSQVLSSDFDTSGDGVFDSAETDAMREQVFTSLKDYGYFTHLRAGSENITFDHVENFAVSDKDGELVFEFDLVLTNPLDPSKTPLVMSLYDPTVYVDLILDGEEPARIAGAEGLDCSVEMGQGDEFESQSYFLAPQEVTLSCAGG